LSKSRIASPKQSEELGPLVFRKSGYHPLFNSVYRFRTLLAELLSLLGQVCLENPTVLGMRAPLDKSDGP
jgi:hypothetical protein